jgi:hypothetical protein
MDVQEILDDSFSVVGVEDPTATEYQQGVRLLADFLATISTEQFSVLSSTEDTLTLVASTGSYTYGSGGDLNSARPTAIKEMTLKNDDDDYSPIKKYTEAEYNAIKSKDTEGKTTHVFYKPNYPLGTLYLWPVPDDAYTLYIYANKRVQTVTALSDTLLVPDEWGPYLKRNMVIELSGHYTYTPTRDDYRLARRTKVNVKATNAESTVHEVDQNLFFI